MRIRDPGWKKTGSGKTSRIRNTVHTVTDRRQHIYLMILDLYLLILDLYLWPWVRVRRFCGNKTGNIAALA